ncbi:MAG: c-type cytochrome [Agriterribacter sp.]
MKYTLLIIATFILVCLGFNCSFDKSKSSFFEETLSAVISIDTRKDTLVQTPKGALIKIPAGAITSGDGSVVQLELKEAYSITDIVKAGLLTQSNGQALSSGGMIYLNVVKGQQATITQKIQIAIPTNFINSQMQLYNGKVNGDGKMNWVTPEPLPENKQMLGINVGQTIFQQKCSGCHGIGKSLTAPDLAHFSKRFPLGEEGDYSYYYHLTQSRDINSIDSFIDDIRHYSYGIYKCNLIHSLNELVGIPFPDISHEAYMDIFRYIQNESDKNQLPLPVHAPLKACADSCEAFLAKSRLLNELKEQSESERQNYIKENGSQSSIASQNLPGSVNSPAPVTFSDFDNLVSVENTAATYYQFSIETFGWYNIDVLLKETDGVQESNLLVNIRGEWRSKVDLFLIIPGSKVFVEGGKTGMKADQYGFLHKNGTINLPQNVKAFILATSERSGKMAFSLQEFITTTQQEINITLEETNKEKFETALNIFKDDGLNISVSETVNASEIKLADAKIESINQQLSQLEAEKPVNCDCDCGQTQDQP